MSILTSLHERSGNCCELCGSTDKLTSHLVAPKVDENLNNSVLVCATCDQQIKDPENAESNHWRCLNDSMWNENAAVKVVAYRMLHHLRADGWPQDLLDMIYLEDADLKWAKETLLADDEVAVVHRDGNGVQLNAGDSIVLIKDLDVKGAGFTAKRGTAVRSITLVKDNHEHIEGRVNGQQIVILTQYVKKT